jgi:O-antigen/teichoic acid export membrane protein
MLSTKTILGASWLVSARLGGRAIDVVTVLVLARTLTPADFGLTALAMTLIAVADTVLEIPLMQALIRMKFVEKSHLDTAFTLGILRGLLLSFVVLAAAWPFSIIFNDSRLTALVAVLAIGPISRSLYSHLARILRRWILGHSCQQRSRFSCSNTNYVSPCTVSTCPVPVQHLGIFDISGMVQFGATGISCELAI